MASRTQTTHRHTETQTGRDMNVHAATQIDSQGTSSNVQHTHVHVMRAHTRHMHARGRKRIDGDMHAQTYASTCIGRHIRVQIQETRTCRRTCAHVDARIQALTARHEGDPTVPQSLVWKVVVLGCITFLCSQGQSCTVPQF